MLLPVELWSYPGTETLHGQFTLAFVSNNGSPKGPFRLWSPLEGIETLLSLDLRAKVHEPERGFAAIAELCPRGEDIAARLAEAVDWKRVEENAHLIPHPSEEWITTFASYSTDVPEGAAAFPARLDLAFPGRFGSRTVVQGVVSVPRDAVRPEKLEGAPEAYYSFLVDGEVLIKDELFEHFRYRFTLPESEATTGGDPGRLPAQPAAGELLAGPQDRGHGGQALLPRAAGDRGAGGRGGAAGGSDRRTAAAGSGSPAPAARRRLQGALGEANAALGSGDQTIRILLPAPGWSPASCASRRRRPAPASPA